MRSTVIMNNKGGVGKTVTAINLADILVREHKKNVVLVDCDGQMNLTRFYLPKFDPEVNTTVADIMRGDGEQVWSDNLMPTLQPGLDLLPGSTDLYDLDMLAIRDAVGDPGKLAGFCRAMAEDGDVDHVIFDCPPGFTLASVAALLAADEVVIPLTVDGFSIIGMEDMRKQIRSLQRSRHGMKIAGVLITQWHNSNVVREGEKLVRSMGVPVFRQTIRRTVKVPESTMEREALKAYAPKCSAAQDYRAWVREFLGEV